MSKYIDLIGRITERLDVPCGNIRLGIHEALAYLDRYPDQVPGRTTTESELIAAVDETNHEDMNEYQKARALLVHLGHTIPDPEPTNAEKLETEIRELFQEPSQSFSIARDLAKKLDEAGVKAPGGGNE